MADLFGAVTDDVLNRIIDFTHARAPYLFNYVAPSIAYITNDQGQVVGAEELWVTCSPVPDPPANVPKYRRMDPFQLPQIPVKLPYSIQLIALTIDFHPSDALALPAELLPPLAVQHFALRASLEFGFACLPDDIVESVVKQRLQRAYYMQLPVLPVTDFDCFLISIFATGHLSVDHVKPAGATKPVDEIRLVVDGIEIVDITPSGLEHMIECYLIAMLKGYVLPENRTGAAAGSGEHAGNYRRDAYAVHGFAQ